MGEWHLRLKNDNPSETGEYVCTCISKIPCEEEYYRYIRVMAYDAKIKMWHDIGHKSGISHNILAWQKQSVCEEECTNEEYYDLMR